MYFAIIKTKLFSLLFVFFKAAVVVKENLKTDVQLPNHYYSVLFSKINVLWVNHVKFKFRPLYLLLGSNCWLVTAVWLVGNRFTQIRSEFRTFQSSQCSQPKYPQLCLWLNFRYYFWLDSAFWHWDQHKAPSCKIKLPP